MSTQLVTLAGGQAVTTSLAIAEGVGNPHASVIRLVRENITDLEDFGRVGFEIQPFETPGGIQSREYAVLNEQQATLLLTYMRNNAVVREFKKRLVRAFFELAKQHTSAPDLSGLGPESLTYLTRVGQALEAAITLAQKTNPKPTVTTSSSTTPASTKSGPPRNSSPSATGPSGPGSTNKNY